MDSILVSRILKDAKAISHAGEFLSTEYLTSEEVTPARAEHYRTSAYKRRKVLERLMAETGLTATKIKMCGLVGELFVPFTDMVWQEKDAPCPSYLVTSHCDHAGGEGAVDNASGMAIMAEVARKLAGIRDDVGFGCFDGEEIAMGSSKMLHEAPHLLKNLKGVINLDGIGQGALVNWKTSRCYSRKNTPFPLDSLPVVTLPRYFSDAVDFTRAGYRASTLTTIDPALLKPGKWSSICIRRRSALDVCNTSNDTADHLHEENLEQAAEIVIQAIEADSAAGSPAP